MSKGINKVILVGNLGNDPDFKKFDGGGAIANFSVATSDAYKDKTGNKVETTEWHKIKVNNRLAEISRDYLKKGTKVYLEGKLQTRKWQDKEGRDQYTTEIVAHEMQILTSKSQSDNSDRSFVANQKEANPQQYELNDDIPF